eukprot:6180113-Pleurochrysis_carterae.AAC.1
MASERSCVRMRALVRFCDRACMCACMCRPACACSREFMEESKASNEQCYSCVFERICACHVCTCGVVWDHAFLKCANLQLRVCSLRFMCMCALACVRRGCVCVFAVALPWRVRVYGSASCFCLRVCTSSQHPLRSSQISPSLTAAGHSCEGYTTVAMCGLWALAVILLLRVGIVPKCGRRP